MPKIPLYVASPGTHSRSSLARLFSKPRAMSPQEEVVSSVVDLRACAQHKRTRAACWVGAVIAACREQTFPLYVTPEPVAVQARQR